VGFANGIKTRPFPSEFFGVKTIFEDVSE